MTNPKGPSGNVYSVYGAPSGAALEKLERRKSQSAVQTSLFSQLGRWPGARSGMAWDAVHAAQEGEKSLAAEGRLSELDAGTLEVMLLAARKTRERAKDVYAQTLAADVVAILGRLHRAAAPAAPVLPPHPARPALRAVAPAFDLSAEKDRIERLRPQILARRDELRAADPDLSVGSALAQAMREFGGGE